MKRRKAGTRYQLLIYQRAMDRIWKSTLPLGLLLIGLWVVSETWLPLIEPPYDFFLFSLGGIVLLFTLFGLLARKMAYVQPFSDHLRLVTPFLRLVISYRRIRSVHPADFRKLFPPQNAGWADHRFLEPFYGMTVVVVELVKYPVKPKVLRLFLPAQFFLPGEPGVVLVVEDWIALSTQIDSFQGAWRGAQTRGSAPPPGSWYKPGR